MTTACELATSENLRHPDRRADAPRQAHFQEIEPRCGANRCCSSGSLLNTLPRCHNVLARAELDAAHVGSCRAATDDPR